MIGLIRLIMSLLGAAATPALIAGVLAYQFMARPAGDVAPHIAQSILSVMFMHALTVAATLGLPMFYGLYRVGWLNTLTVPLTSTLAGFIALFFCALMSDMFGGSVGLASMPITLGYALLAPLSGLTAWLVWKTFPMPDRITEASHA